MIYSIYGRVLYLRPPIVHTGHWFLFYHHACMTEALVHSSMQNKVIGLLEASSFFPFLDPHSLNLKRSHERLFVILLPERGDILVPLPIDLTHTISYSPANHHDDACQVCLPAKHYV